MSRTLKDRPYWVKANDKSLPRTPRHYHEEAGEPLYRYMPVKDENGNKVMETFTRRGLVGYRIYHYYEGYKLYPTWEELVADVPKDYIHFDRRFYAHYGDVEATRVKREKVLIGYRPDGCTIDDYIPRPNSYWDNDTISLCYHQIDYWATGYRHGNNFPSKDERRNYHGAARSNEKDALRKLTKAANAGYDCEDEDAYTEVLTSRSRRHIGWWC